MTGELGQGTKKLTDSDYEKGSMVWSPDSKLIYFTSADRKLYKVDVESGAVKEVTSSDTTAINGPQVSPDGKWVLYSRSDRDVRPRLFINSADGGGERDVVGDELFSAMNGRWTPDGRKIVFTAGTMQGGVASTRQSTMQLYSVSLIKEEKDPQDKGIDSEEAAAAAAPSTPRRPGGPPEAAPKVGRKDRVGRPAKTHPAADAVERQHRRHRHFVR